jgi:hypothetical protein
MGNEENEGVVVSSSSNLYDATGTTEGSSTAKGSVAAGIAQGAGTGIGAGTGVVVTGTGGQA